jgi:S-adenosylmethionine uptake transporter
MGEHLPLFQFLLLRSVCAAAILLVLAWRSGALKLPRLKRDRQLILLRSVAEMFAAWLFLTALIHMPIANLSAILQALPLTVALAAALVLREEVGWRRFMAIGIGFIGVYMIVRPGSEGFTGYSVLGILSVLAVTVRDLAARRISHEVKSMTVALATVLCITGFAAVGAVGTDWQPMRPLDWVWLTGSVATVIAGYHFSVAAMRVGEIGFVAPFRYTSLLVALILGFLVFGDWPDGFTLVGACIVVATGLFTLWRERRAGAPAPVPFRIR